MNWIDTLNGWKWILRLDIRAWWLTTLFYSPFSQGQANANDWVAEAVKDVNILTRSSSVAGYSPSGIAGSLTDSETAATLLPILQAQRERFRYSSHRFILSSDTFILQCSNVSTTFFQSTYIWTPITITDNAIKNWKHSIWSSNSRWRYYTVRLSVFVLITQLFTGKSAFFKVTLARYITFTYSHMIY